MLQTFSIAVSGKVQGVFFRQSTKEKAVKLGITGEVRNTPDGMVFIKATGSREQLEQLIQWCRQGPPRAVVKQVEVNELPLQSFGQFRIERS
ncbi:MAG: acylphosphatase [Chitinophagaceae bacterium]